MTLLSLVFALWMGYLAAEALRLRRWQKALPLRISVTGTRGKTSVARMVASVLRAHGWRVVAKTTGSQARILLPDGAERPVRRRGVPSIQEQIGLLGIAAREHCQAVVAEVMSVHRENHLVESRKILRPHLVLVTNFRVDHTEAAGWAREEVAALHLADIPPGATVLIPEEELLPGFAEAVEALGATLVPVPIPQDESSESGAFNAPGDTPPFQAANLALARATAQELGVPEEVTIQGLQEARGDLGAHWIRRYQLTDSHAGAIPVSRSAGGHSEEESRTVSHPLTALTVNAFAANDPLSTGLLLDWAKKRVGEAEESREIIGLLNLRADRGDRTLQWLEAMGAGFRNRFHRLYLTGFHAPAFRRGLARKGLGGGVHVMREEAPARIMGRILAESHTPEPILFGFGNFGGMGESMVAHWLEKSEEVAFSEPRRNGEGRPDLGTAGPNHPEGGVHGP